MTRIVRSLFLAAGLCALPCALQAGQPASGTSAGGHVHYEIRTTADGKEVWVYRDNEKGRINKMCETVGSDDLKLFISPDERWIIVQDGGASLGVSLRVFFRTGDHSYSEREKDDIGAKVEIAALKSAMYDAKEISEKRFTQCFGWSADSEYLLVCVSGKGSDATNSAQFRWIGVYDVETGKVTTDLSKMNKNGVRLWPHAARVSGLPEVGLQ